MSHNDKQSVNKHIDELEIDNTAALQAMSQQAATASELTLSDHRTFASCYAGASRLYEPIASRMRDGLKAGWYSCTSAVTCTAAMLNSNISHARRLWGCGLRHQTMIVDIVVKYIGVISLVRLLIRVIPRIAGLSA